MKPTLPLPAPRAKDDRLEVNISQGHWDGVMTWQWSVSTIRPNGVTIGPEMMLPNAHTREQAHEQVYVLLMALAIEVRDRDLK